VPFHCATQHAGAFRQSEQVQDPYGFSVSEAIATFEDSALTMRHLYVKKLY
jgi:hypothetical protein